MVVIRHENDKRKAMRMSHRRAKSTAKALNKHEGTIAWRWTYQPVRLSLWRYVLAAYDKQGRVYGYFSGTIFISPS